MTLEEYERETKQYFKSISNERKIKFTLNGKSTELGRYSQILLWVLRTELD